MPDPLTAGFSLDQKNVQMLSVVLRTCTTITILPDFLASSVWKKCVSDWSRYFLTGNRTVDGTKRGWPGD